MYSITSAQDSPLSIAPQPEIPAESATQLSFEQVLAYFTPHVYVTPALIAVNVWVFLAMIIAGFNPDHASPQILLKWGADFGPSTVTAGEWWRAVTSMFVHLGALHIVFNMLVLFQIGPIVERLLGNIAFAIVYLLSGIAGAMTSLAWQPYTISAGASGAIFGLYGALIGFLCLRSDSIPKPLLSKIIRSAIMFLIYNAVYGVIRSGTDFAAHAGGLIGGLLCGLAISNPLCAGYTRRRTIRAMLLLLVAGAVLPLAALRLPRPLDFLAELKKCGVAETKADAAYRRIAADARTRHLSDGQIAERLQADVIRPWSETRASIARLQTAGLPRQQRHIADVLVGYMDARKQAWAVLVHGLQTHNPTLVAEYARQQTQAVNAAKAELDGSR